MDDGKKYIEDRKFLKWVFDPDPETEKYYTDYLEAHPEEKDEILLAKKELSLLTVRNRKSERGKKEIIYYRLLKEMQKENLSRSFRMRYGFVRYAAVALLFFAIGSLFMDQLRRNQKSTTVEESLLVKSAALNTMVYLADGSQREIGCSKAIIDFSFPGYLIINSDSIKIGTIASVNPKNLVVVPYGKRARVKLYDRSIVNLSAGSRIILPVQFASEERSAYLVGEAFFDIVRDPERPFFVETSSSMIKVLGTSFNVCAYSDHPELAAFLQEGKIRFRSTEDFWFSGWLDLKPGDQLTLNKKTKQINVTQGDQQYYQLWKEGIIQFNNETVHDLLIRVGQYYNITLKVADHRADGRRIKGKLDLNADRNEIFKYIENITDGKIIKINAGEFMLK
ncbi:MAG: FecR family protein [Mangrovibacterium sp.]